MKHLTTFLIAAGTFASLLRAEIEEDIPYGIEAVTGLRSAYTYRGLELASSTLDFQLAAEVAVDNQLSVGAGAWIATESDGDFYEQAGFLELHTTLGDAFTASAGLTYHRYGGSAIRSGFDLSGSLRWHAYKDWSFSTSIAHDYGSGGWYSELTSDWFRRLSDDAFLSGRIGISATKDYYGISGLSDLSGRVALTYNINSMLSVSPFIGWSYELQHRDGDEMYGGVWFEASF